jgi:hypothetical protein
LKKSSFSIIYEDPTSYVRVFEKDQIENESNYPAYIAYKSVLDLPKRIVESGIMLMSSKEVILVFLIS